MPEYKKLLSGYINDSKKGDGQYLTITNVSDEEITLKPGGKIFLNKTPQHILDQYPKVPHFSKSVKVEDQVESSEENIEDQIPF